MNISEVRKSPDKMVIADIYGAVLSAKEQVTEEREYNGKHWVETSQWVLLKCMSAEDNSQNPEDVIGAKIVGKPVLTVGDQIEVKSTSGKKGFNGIKIGHWMKKDGSPTCGLNITKAAHITKNGESYNNVHEGAVPTVLNKPPASQKLGVSDLADLQARLYVEWRKLLPILSNYAVLTESRLDANTLLIKGTKDITAIVDLKSYFYQHLKSGCPDEPEDSVFAEAGFMGRTAFIQGLKVPEVKQPEFTDDDIPF